MAMRNSTGREIGPGVQNEWINENVHIAGDIQSNNRENSSSEGFADLESQMSEFIGEMNSDVSDD
jgi:hypothetical protein